MPLRKHDFRTLSSNALKWFTDSQFTDWHHLELFLDVRFYDKLAWHDSSRCHPEVNMSKEEHQTNQHTLQHFTTLISWRACFISNIYMYIQCSYKVVNKGGSSVKHCINSSLNSFKVQSSSTMQVSSQMLLYLHVSPTLAEALMNGSIKQGMEKKYTDGFIDGRTKLLHNHSISKVINFNVSKCIAWLNTNWTNTQQEQQTEK